MSGSWATGSSRSTTCRRSTTGWRHARHRRRRARRDARVHRPARALGRLAVRGRRPRQPPAPGVHDPAVRQLRRHARADHRSLAASSSSCRSARTSWSRAGGPSASTWTRSTRCALGPNVAFLVGHGTVRGSVIGAEAGAADDLQRRAMVREVEAALDAGAFGLSSGLIYAPGMHAGADEIAALVTTATRRGGLYATHMRNESAGLFASLDESIATIRAAATGAPTGRGSRSRTSSAARGPCGAAPARPSRSSRRRGPRASTSPPTSTRTRRPPRPSRRSCRRPARPRRR